MMTSGSILLLASVAFVTNDLIEFRRSMLEDLFILAELVAINSTPGLLFQDQDAVHMNLLVLKADPHILLTHVFDREGQRFTSYFLDNFTPPAEFSGAYLAEFPLVYEHVGANSLPPALPAKGLHQFDKQFVDVVRQVVFEGEVIGAVYIRSDLTAFNQRLLWAASIMVIVLMIALILAFVLASYFQHAITAPVYHLLDSMRQVGEAKDYSLRAQKNTHDELGKLVDGFNDMLAQIEQSSTELKEYRDHLEDMVRQRTAELAESRDQALAANEALHKRTGELAVAKNQAEAANRAKSVFLANMSHELRTPLNGILGYAQIMARDKQLNEKQRDGVGIIERSGNYLLTLINDILDLSKIEAGRIELYPEDFLFHDFITSLTELFSIRAQQKGVRFICEAPPYPSFDGSSERGLPVALHTDEKRLRQILINLLGNAVKFTEHGEVRLKIGYDGDDMRFQVEDTGPGIADADLDKIFQPFQQVGDVMHKAEGTGLGLSITKKLVEMMGGELNVASTPGRGSIFGFKIRVDVAETVPAAIHTPPAAIVTYACEPEAAPYKILVIDDKIENRLVIINLLEPLGFKVVEAEDGEQGAEMANTVQPDLIVMDLVMPKIDGLECTRRIRLLPGLQETPIVVASASAFDADKQRSFEAGASDFVTKPLDAEILLASLQRNLHLEWIYETPEEDLQALEENILEGEFVGPAPEHAATLFHLAMRGDINAVSSFVTKLEEEDEKYHLFAVEIRELAKEFREEEICELVEQFME